MVNGVSVSEDVHGTKKDDILLSETGVKVSFGECHAVAYALVIPCSLGKFLGVNHLTPSASAASLGHIDKILLSMRHSFCTLLHF